MLNLYNFPSELKELILSCLKQENYTPLINGKKCTSFRPFQGIRQGDPISPYIFILGMELITHLIQQKISTKLWTPYKFRNNEPIISHLFFANDIILFSTANIVNIEAVKDVLCSCCSLSGLSINLDKSRVWFSKTVNTNTLSHFQNSMGIRVAPDLGFYLGYPLKPTYINSDFNFIIDKINKKM